MHTPNGCPPLLVIASVFLAGLNPRPSLLYDANGNEAQRRRDLRSLSAIARGVFPTLNAWQAKGLCLRPYRRRLLGGISERPSRIVEHEQIQRFGDVSPSYPLGQQLEGFIAPENVVSAQLYLSHRAHLLVV